MTPALRQNLTLAVLVLTGINMRPLLTSIGPLLPDIRAASGMSYTLAALLTALPVIAMGVLALAAGWVDRYIGQKRSIALSLLIIAAGALLREIAPNSGLLLTSALAGGIGIGIIQAAIPAVIKHLFPRRTPLVMGLWSAALMGGGGLGAAFTPWLASHSAAWHDALAWWALPALLALLSWLAICRHLPRAPHQTSASSRVRDYWPAPRLDRWGLYFGPGSIARVYRRSLIALAASLLHPARRQRQYSGSLLALLTVSMAALQDMRFILLLVGLGVLWWICARLGTLAGKVQGGDAGLLGRCGYAASGGFAAAGHPGSDPGQLACCAGASGRFLVCADGIPIRAIQGGKRNGDLPGGVQHGLQALQCGAAAGCGACCAVRGILT